MHILIFVWYSDTKYGGTLVINYIYKYIYIFKLAMFH